MAPPSDLSSCLPFSGFTLSDVQSEGYFLEEKGSAKAESESAIIAGNAAISKGRYFEVTSDLSNGGSRDFEVGLCLSLQQFSKGYIWNATGGNFRSGSEIFGSTRQFRKGDKLRVYYTNLGKVYFAFVEGENVTIAGSTDIPDGRYHPVISIRRGSASITTSRFGFELSEYDIDDEVVEPPKPAEIAPEEIPADVVEQPPVQDQVEVPITTENQAKPKKQPKPVAKELEALGAGQLERVFKRLPPDMLLSAGDEDDMPLEPESSLKPPSNLERVDLIFPPPKKKPPTEAELRALEEKSRAEEEARKRSVIEREEAAKKKAEEDLLVANTKLAKKMAKKRLEEEEKAAKKRKEEEEHQAKKRAEEEEKQRKKEILKRQKDEEEASNNRWRLISAREKAEQDRIEAAKLKVSRFMPEGNQKTNDHTKIIISITFNQPLINDGQSIDDIPWRPTITPEVNGNGKWSLTGKDTLVFSATPFSEMESNVWRLSTMYSVSIKKGSQGILKEGMQDDFSFRFSTPTLTVKKTWPEDTNERDMRPNPVFFVEFDQRVNPGQVIPSIKILVDTNKPYAPLEVVEDAREVPELCNLLHIAREGYYVTFKCSKALPNASNIRLCIGPDIPSDEGPLLSPAQAEIKFSTVAAFAVKTYSFNTSPAEIMTLRFNQPLLSVGQTVADLSWRPSITPEIPGKVIFEVDGMNLRVRSDQPLANSTKYVVKIPAGTKSAWEDALQKDFTFENSTPVMSLTERYPMPPKKIQTLQVFVLHFTQRINREDVFKAIQLTQDQLIGKKKFPLRMLTKSEAAESSTAIFNIVGKLEEDYWIAVAPTAKLPYGTVVTLRIGEIGSKEGPLKMTDKLSFEYTTIDQLAVYHTDKSPYRWTAPLEINFSHPMFEGDNITWTPSIVPNIAGNWTLNQTATACTLIFKQTVDWPNSHDFVVTVPAGVKSLFGDDLPAPVTFSIFTPTIKLLQKFPTAGLQPLTPVMFLGFDQLIEPKEVIECVHLWKGDGKEAKETKKTQYLKTTLIKEEDACSDYPSLTPWILLAKPGCWLAFILSEPAPYSTHIFVRVGPEVKSKEGPKLGKLEDTFDFVTVPKFGLEIDKCTPIFSSVVVASDVRPKLVFNQNITRGDQKVEDLGWIPKITPEVPGKWEFEGLNGLKFVTETADAFKNSTEYTISLPPSTTSTANEVFGEESVASFSTSLVRVTSCVISDGYPEHTRIYSPTPLIFVSFDQAIDREEVLKTVRIYKKNSLKKLFPVRFATEAEIDGSNHVKSLVSSAISADHYVVFTTTKNFSWDTQIIVHIGPNIVSKEGPIKSPQEHSTYFNVAPQLKITPVHLPVVNKHSTAPSKSIIHLRFNHVVDPKLWADKIIINPAPPGEATWRITPSPDTTNFVFEPDQPWAQSTRYTIDIPAGLTTVQKEVTKATTFEFSTATIDLLEYNSYLVNTANNGVYWATFNQMIDPEATVQCISFKVSSMFGKKVFCGARLATPEEMTGSYYDHVRELSRKHEGFGLAFKPVTDLPSSTKLTISIGPNIPSVVGPLKSNFAREFNIETDPPFVITSHPKTCVSGNPIVVYFSRSLDMERFHPSMVSLEPMLRDLKITASGSSSVTITGSLEFNEDADLKITFSPEIADFRGQKLGFDTTLTTKMTATSFSCYLTSHQEDLFVYDPFLHEAKRPPTFTIKSFNYRELRVCLYKMNVEINAEYWKIHQGEVNSDTEEYVRSPHKKVFDKVLPVTKFKRDREVDFDVDFSEALEDVERCIGQVGVVITPTMKAHHPNYWHGRNVITTWIQCTRLGIDVLAEHNRLFAWATDLVTGKPLPGVKFIWDEKSKDRIVHTENQHWEGFLFKKSKVLKIDAWKKRFVVLKDQKILVYKDRPVKQKEQDHVADTLELKHYNFSEVPSSSHKYPYCFIFQPIADAPDNKVHIFSSDTYKTYHDCKEMIIAAGARENRRLALTSSIQEDGSVEVAEGKEEVASDVAPPKIAILDDVPLKRAQILESPVLSNAEGCAFIGPTDRMKKGEVLAKDLPLIARFGRDVAFVKNIEFQGDSYEFKTIYHVFDDRKMYRPGEEVHIKGYLRVLSRPPDQHFPILQNSRVKKFTYKIEDSRSVGLGSGEFSVNEFGAFSFSFPLPTNANLGEASVLMTEKEDENGNSYFVEKYTHTFELQEFRRPDFKAQSSIHKQPVYNTLNCTAIIKGEASYYAGGKLPDCPVTWIVESSAGTFSPPGLSRYIFNGASTLISGGPTELKLKRDLKGKTKDDGAHYVKINIYGKSDPPVPISFASLFEVMDLNQQVIKANSNFILHPCKYYIGVFTTKEGASPKETLPIEFVVADINGKYIEDVPIELSLNTVMNNFTSYVDKVQLASLKNAATKFKFEIQNRINPESPNVLPLTLNITATVSDPDGRKNSTNIIVQFGTSVTQIEDLDIDVDYGRSRRKMPPPKQVIKKPKPDNLTPVVEEQLQLSVSGEDFHIGQLVDIVVESPFAPCEAVMMITTNQIVKSKTFEMKKFKEVVTVQILESYVPNIGLRIEAVGQALRKNNKGDLDVMAPRRPAFATGSINLTVSRESKQLALEVVPGDSQLEPGGSTEIVVKVCDYVSRQPQKDVEVALIVVDESVLALSGYDVENPVNTFYPLQQQLAMTRKSLRSLISVETWEAMLKIDKNAAATTMQRIARGYLARRLLKKLKEEKRLAEEARRKAEEEARRKAEEEERKKEEEMLRIEEDLRKMDEESMELDEAMYFKSSLADARLDSAEAAPMRSAMKMSKKKSAPLGFAFGGRGGSSKREKSEEKKKSKEKEESAPKRKQSMARSSSTSPKLAMEMDMASPSMAMAGPPMAPLMNAMSARRSLAPPPPPSGAPSAKASRDESASEADDEDWDAKLDADDGQIETKEEEIDAGPVIQVRTNFNPLANFTPGVVVDSNGFARIPISVPDNITRYRVWAIAVSKDNVRYGIGDSLITARLPILVRTTAPRFLNFGDTSEVVVVIQNLTEKILDVKMAVRCANATLGTENMSAVGFLAEVFAEGRRAVHIPIKTLRPGKIQLQISCVAGAYGDASQIEIPVYAPPTAESFSANGHLEKIEDALQLAVMQPGDALPGFGRVEVEASTTAFQTLVDALGYVWEYPYGCNEQLTTKILCFIPMQDILAAFNLKDLPSKAKLNRWCTKALKQIKDRQSKNGSFSMWGGKGKMDYEDLYITGYVAMGIAVIKEKGFDIPGTLIFSWLEKLEKCLENVETYEGYHDKDHMISTVAFAYYARNRLNPSAKIKTQVEKFYKRYVPDEIPMEALGWMLSVLGDQSKDVPRSPVADEIARYLNDHVSLSQTDSDSATYASYYVESTRHYLLHSAVRTDAILLEALIIGDRNSPVIPKLVRGIFDRRENGRWRNTQENAWVIMALGRYFDAFEKETPNFKARVWIQDVFAGLVSFEGHSMTTRTVKIPMKYIESLPNKSEAAVAAAPSPTELKKLVVHKEGTGRMYYRISMTYAPKSFYVAPQIHGFLVTRTYTAGKESETITTDNEGILHIKKGMLVRITVTMKFEMNKYHIALVDNMPAGFEAENEALKTQNPTSVANFSSELPVIKEPVWYNHRNLRDDRAEVFADRLSEGTYVFTYLARATAPGRYVAPPAKAEEMYRPEIFGHCESAVVIIDN
eukprot:TRINITY_DN803_c0_g1_i1.p1 TRINITY_DN803_c0_g1~~TRINITY_DN803_c0_g1_i1.p1  ORF type:complete len:3646 (-),score=1090.84 TRINITY_DN803_c0_g1_i1:14-10951(-)